MKQNHDCQTDVPRHVRVRSIGTCLLISAGLLIVVWLGASMMLFFVNEQRSATGRPDLECYSTPADYAVALSVAFAQISIGLTLRAVGSAVHKKSIKTPLD